MSWTSLAHLPVVSPWNKGRRSYTWEQRRDHYASLLKEPIVIKAEITTPFVHAEHGCIHLDGVLSYAALVTHPVASHFGGKACVVPLPLELVWTSEQGLPLWACTPLVPDGEYLEAKEYWHKRYPVHRAEFGDRLNACTTAGRWREYRVPLAVQSPTRLRALAIGNAEETERLLLSVTHIGKKTSIGYGRVIKWSVERGAHDLEDVLARRFVPVAYYKSPPNGVIEHNRGWTPPYWYAPWWADCIYTAS